MENPGVLKDPEIFLGQKGFEDRRRDIGMIERAERVADVVEQRHHDIFLVAAIAVRARRGLQAMFEPIDRKAAIIAAEQLQMLEDALAIVRREFRSEERRVGKEGVSTCRSWWSTGH